MKFARPCSEITDANFWKTDSLLFFPPFLYSTITRNVRKYRLVNFYIIVHGQTDVPSSTSTPNLYQNLGQYYLKSVVNSASIILGLSRGLGFQKGGNYFVNYKEQHKIIISVRGKFGVQIGHYVYMYMRIQQSSEMMRR